MAHQVYGADEPEAIARDTLRTTLWRLRKKLGRAGDGRPYIVNVRGRGYMFVKANP
jgi:DNA-binding response OmpR family regulator